MRKAAVLVLALLAFWALHRPAVPDDHAAEVPLVALKNLKVDWTQKYPERFSQQIAVLWSDPSERGLGLIHALNQMGLPFFVTRNLDEALRHRMLMIYPGIDGRTFTPEQTMRIQHFVEGGGSLWSQHVAAGGFRPIFGFASVDSNRCRHRVDFQPAADVCMVYLDRPEERTVSIGDPKLPEVIWSDGYKPSAGTRALAKFEDGSAAVLRHDLGRGSAIAWGVGLTDVVARSEANRDFEAQRKYVNAFEPGADVWRLMLRGWFESRTPDWARLATMPEGLRSTLLLTHDVDWEYSLKGCVDYADVEQPLGAHSTLFVQTKYLDDSNSRGFFYGKNLQYLRDVKARGWDVESHSVIHAMGFNKFPPGDGTESFATYRAVTKGDQFPGGTVFGELRVSKSLLEGEIPGEKVLCFRAGHLRVPPVLPQTLERCGYEFDSSFTACDLMTNFPFPLTRDLDFSTESTIYEFPVTFEDEASPLADRIPQTLDVIAANADNEGLSVLLIHTNDPKVKGPSERAILQQLPKDVGVSDLLSFARFWRARDHVRWELQPGAQGDVLKVQAAEAVKGLSFETKRPIASVSSPCFLKGGRIVIPALEANQSLTVHIHYR